MSSTQPTFQKMAAEESSRTWLKSSDQLRLLVLAASLLVMSGSYWWYREGHRGGLIEIDRAEPLHTHYRVDINRADWPEMIQLPRLGETMARRIMAEREENGPFRSHDDLVRVYGIGPKTLELIRPYLHPIPSETDRADASGPQSAAAVSQ